MKGRIRRDSSTTARERTIQYRSMILAGEPVDVPLKIKGVRRDINHLTNAQRVDLKTVEDREEYLMSKAKWTPQAVAGEPQLLREGQRSSVAHLREIEQGEHIRVPLHASSEAKQSDELAALRHHEEHSAASSTPTPSLGPTHPHISPDRALRTALDANAATYSMPHDSHSVQPASPLSPVQARSTRSAALSPDSPPRLAWPEQDRPIYSPPPSPSHSARTIYHDALW